MTSSKIINTLAETIDERRKVYGHPHVNFTQIAELWNVAFQDILAGEFTSCDVAQAMRLVKEARLMNTPYHTDSLLDIAGYAVAQEAIVEILNQPAATNETLPAGIAGDFYDETAAPKRKTRKKQKVDKRTKAYRNKKLKAATKKRKYTKRSKYWKKAA